MRLPLELNLPDVLIDELRSVSAQHQLPVALFVAEVLHADLASRRLPSVTQGRCGARLIGDTSAAEPEDDFTEPVSDVEPALLTDLEVLDGIS